VRFELRKDFGRLRDAGPMQRAAILRRLAYYDGSPMDGSATRATAFERLLRDYPVTDTSAFHAIESAFDASEILVFDGEKKPEYAIGTLAQQGDVSAQAAIGWQFFADQEYEKAIVWLDLAASGGDPLAEVYAGLAYRSLAEEHTEDDDEPLAEGPTPHARFSSLANDRLNHAGRAARRLLASGDPTGAVIVATMYAGRADDRLSFSPREIEHYACIGRYVRPIWLAGFDHEAIARDIEEGLQSSCDEVLGGWSGGDDGGVKSVRAK
jgi:TPR repeat protein